MRLLVVGAGGHLGSEVARLASAAGHAVSGTATTPATGWSPLDIRDRAAVHTLMASVRPELVVNTAYRATEWATCADGAANVALAAAAAGARLVHVSTDAVHPGRPAPYGDDVDPAPITMYGAAKAAAETAVRAVDPAAVIARTSLIIGDTRSKQVQLALDLARGVRPGALFTDEIRCPIDATDLAAALLDLAATDYAGVLNVAGPQALSRAALGHLIARSHGLDPGAITTCPVAEGGLGPRPTDVKLDSTRATTLIPTRLRPPAEALTAARHP
ncbi:sugar nucleotide-binding protein [Actinoplanes sp. N902-109]|uniref:sugar nucleotide-binding protein n=1 Tax=Actinoplanes sp. (strain N902-109) TaxID=649831 RepID=UPI00032943AA|nr:sugar nucleotide-binding protein [Actinoplanes sp. N902-109]AGL19468.1 nad-dependent epimerase/dehydratase [Actinoplanes sp. N902-109]